MFLVAQTTDGNDAHFVLEVLFVMIKSTVDGWMRFDNFYINTSPDLTHLSNNE